jgi:hypothetical protein
MKAENESIRTGGRVRGPALLSLALGTLVAATAQAAAPRPDDYSQGIVIEAPQGLPLIEMAMPESVYQTTTRADLADLRVFNADGTAIPHAFCTPAEMSPPVIEQHNLSIFQLRAPTRGAAAGSQIEVQTSGGTQVRVQQNEPVEESASKPSVHIIDVRTIEQGVRAIEFDWNSPDGASEARVRIQASDDLDRWTNIVAASTLLQVEGANDRLGRKRIEVPPRRYQYLRVERADGGPALQIESALAETVSPGADIEPTWFTAELVNPRDADVLTFDTRRMAPIQFARLRLPQNNTSVRFQLASRPDEASAWRERWSGESYSILTERGLRVSPPARFDPVADRYWQVRMPVDVSLQPALELAYRPVRLRFLAQGASPYTLAFGSRRAEAAAPASCDGLLADVKAEDRAQMLAEGYPGMPRTLGGEVALTPMPEKTPLRLVVLWGVLVTGVALLVAMALSLLRRLRAPGE